MSFIPNKSQYIDNSILLALYSLVFILFTFILVKVIRTKDKAYSCTIILMMICLQLAALSKFNSFLIIFTFIYIGAIMNKSLTIWEYNKGNHITFQSLNLYLSLKQVFFECRYLFMELAIMLNISKWIYFFFVIQTHRDIR